MRRLYDFFGYKYVMYLTMRKYLFLSRSNRVNAGSDENDYSGEYEDARLQPIQVSTNMTDI